MQLLIGPRKKSCNRHNISFDIAAHNIGNVGREPFIELLQNSPRLLTLGVVRNSACQSNGVEVGVDEWDFIKRNRCFHGLDVKSLIIQESNISHRCKCKRSAGIDSIGSCSSHINFHRLPVGSRRVSLIWGICAQLEHVSMLYDQIYVHGHDAI